MACPYPGLRPFTRDEAYIFFGREEQTDDLLKRLSESRFLAVVGPSGCGKSSLVRAGMIPALETGFMLPAGPRWAFAQMRPGSRPTRRLAEALVKEAGYAPPGLDAAEALGLLHALLLRGPLGLVEALRETPLPNGSNLLVLVDQFEEIFRFRREGNADEADAFVSLLLRCTEQREQPIYVVITMRSDFFGDCALFNGLPEAINRSQYLTPRLTREQRQAAIEGPARVFGGDVEPALVNHLLNEMSNDPDQLPLLQHLLMRMWTWRGETTQSCSDRPTPVADSGITDVVEGAHTLTMEDYESVGGLANALSDHAEEAFRTLTPAQQHIAQIMFRRLSERGLDNRDVRRPSPAGEIAALAGVSVDEVVRVVDVFRAPGCSFVVPACPEPIHAANVLDITHESFLRQWKRLKGWIDDETQSVETYRFLEQSARHWEEGRAALWGSPNLDVALAWREKEQPTAEWAKRYGGDFERAMAFLEASEHARRAELARKQAVRKAAVRRWRRIAAGSFALMVLMAGGFAYYMYDQVWEHRAYYNGFIKKWGIAEGYGRLTEAQRRARLISLEVVREGRSGPVKYIKAVNAAGRCDPRHGIGTVLEFNQPDSPSHQECRWEFVRDARHDVAYELAFNQFGTFVRGFAYTPKTPELGEKRRAHFLDARGQIAPVKNSQAEMLEITYSPEGYEILHAYFDRDGNPQPGRDLAYSQRRSFSADGLELELVSLDKDGQPMNDTVGNASLRLAYDPLGNVVRAEAFDKNGNKITTTEGWQRFEAEYDEAGNLTEGRFFNALGGPALSESWSAHRVVNEYTKRGFLRSQAYYGTSSEPVEPVDFGYHKVINTAFDENGNVTHARYYAKDGSGAKDNNDCHAIRYKYNDFGQAVEKRCYDLNHSAINNKNEYHLEKTEYDTGGNAISYSFFDVDGLRTLSNDGYHRLVFSRDKRGNIRERAYFDESDSPANHADGYHRSTIDYNQLGHPVEWRYYAADGAPVATANGYHRAVAAYNERGHQTSIAYFGVDGRPVKSKSGYHREAIENDEQGNDRELAYYDEAGQLVALPDGYAVIRKDYDIRGNVTEERTFGPAREPIPHASGCTIWRAQYDDQSRRVMAECFDGNEKPVRFAEGYARWTRKYDANGNMIEEVHYDEKGGLIAPPDGYAKQISQYNERNEITEWAFYDEHGRLKMQEMGFAKVKVKYDDRGNRTEATFYGEENRLILFKGQFARRSATFDEYGNQTEEAYFGTDDRLRLQRDGYARWTKKFDERGNQIEQAYYDANDELMLRPEGYAKWTKQFDHNNREIEVRYFGADGRPARHRDGYARQTTKYDERGNHIEQAYYGEDGRLLMQPGGYAVGRAEYDAQNRMTMLAFYDDQDRLTLDEGRGFAVKRWAFAEADGGVVETLLDDNTQIIVRIETRRDGEGEIVRRILGPSGEAFVEAVFVRRVLPDSTAESLALQPGDRLVSYDGIDVRSPEDMQTMVNAREPAVRILVIERNGQRLSFAVPRGIIGIEMSRRFVPADQRRADAQKIFRETPP